MISKNHISRTKQRTVLKLYDCVVRIVGYYQKKWGKNTIASMLFLKSIYDLEKVILAKKSKLHFLRAGHFMKDIVKKISSISLKTKKLQLFKLLCTPRFISQDPNVGTVQLRKKVAVLKCTYPSHRSGSGRPKKLWIRIRNTGFMEPHHWFKSVT